MGNIHFSDDPKVDWECEWEWGPSVEETSTVEDIRQSLAKYELHHFVYGEELPLGRWISKQWNTIDFRKCLSCVLECDTSDWVNVDLCEGVEKLCPDIFMRTHQGYRTKYFIRKKYDWELYN
jgi:hypothetical protein